MAAAMSRGEGTRLAKPVIRREDVQREERRRQEARRLRHAEAKEARRKARKKRRKSPVAQPHMDRENDVK